MGRTRGHDRDGTDAMGKKLQVRQAYRNREYAFRAGDIIEVSDEIARYLMTDAPVAFVEVTGAEPETADVEAPPVDKMVRKPRRKKTVG